MSTLTLGWFQGPTLWQDPAGNRQQFGELFAAQLPKAEVELVVLPEMFSTGFSMASAQLAEPMSGPTVEWMREQAQRWQVHLCGSLIVVEQEQFYNRLLWVAPNGEVQHYDKRHRFRMAGEHHHFAAGNERVILTLGDWRILASVCYDLRFPVWLRNRDDYDLLLCVANWPAARQQAWATLLDARAVENQCYALGVNIVGTDGNGLAYAGGSALVDANAQRLVDCGDGVGFYMATLGREALLAQREAFPVWQDADEFELRD